jgi:sugar (pentulose or hexulose) kinase
VEKLGCRVHMRDLGVKEQMIEAVTDSAFKTMGGCRGIFLDANDHQVRPMISWHDNRTTAEVKEIAARIDERELYRLTGYPDSTTWLLFKMM